MTSPYQGKPFLKIAESFVMKAIGEIAPTTEVTLQNMTPKLQQIYGVSGSWDEITKKVLDLPEGIETEIRQLWEKNRELAAKKGHVLSPEAFTVAYIDKFIASTNSA